jgi:ribosomal protein L7/L12
VIIMVTIKTLRRVLRVLPKNITIKELDEAVRLASIPLNGEQTTIGEIRTTLRQGMRKLVADALSIDRKIHAVCWVRVFTGKGIHDAHEIVGSIHKSLMR